MNYIIQEFLPTKASQELWNHYFTFQKQAFQEENPHDPLPSMELEKEHLLHPHPHYTSFCWILFMDEKQTEIVGKGSLWFPNEHSPDFSEAREKVYGYITILKKYRRKGLATEILKTLIDRALKFDKKVFRVEVETDSARAFCNFLDGEITAHRATNRLYLNKVDWSLMDQWRQEGRTCSKGSSIHLFEIIPEDLLSDFCDLYTTVSADGPIGDLASPIIITPARRRADEHYAKQNDYDWITIVSKERDGRLSGLTEIYHNKKEPFAIYQNLTGVLQSFRDKGLGKWLKAEMLFYLRDHFPHVQFIQTGNNDTNAPMLSINIRMGFQKHQTQTFYEFNIAQLIQKILK